MTKEEVVNLIKRYPYVSDAIKLKQNRAEFYRGNRKLIIEITEEVKKVCEIVELVYKKEKVHYIKKMIRNIMLGESDIFSIKDFPYCKNSFYVKKQAFIDKVYDCCIAWNLVSLEEILREDIA